VKSDFQRKVYSVSQIAVEIRDMIERKFLDIGASLRRSAEGTAVTNP